MIKIVFWKLYFFFSKLVIKLNTYYFRISPKLKFPNKGLRVGLSGCGNFTRCAYIPAFNKEDTLIKISGLFSNSRHSSEKIQKFIRYKTKIFLSYDELLNSGIKGVILVLPNHLHYQYIIKALESGVDVLCEKPVTNNIDDAVRIQEYLAKTKNILMIGFNQRYLDRTKIIKLLIENNELGEIYQVEAFHNQNIASHLKKSNWLNDSRKSGGGVLYNAGIHLINLMLYFFGSVDSVFAKLEYKEIPRAFGEDTAVCDFCFKSGVKGRLTASYINEVNSSYEHLVIKGDKGVIYTDMMTSSIMYKANHLLKWRNIHCKKELVVNSVFNELLHFYNCIEKRIKPDTDIVDSINTLRVLEAAYMSSSEKGRVFVK